MARKTFEIGDMVVFSYTATPVRYQGRTAQVVGKGKENGRVRYAIEFPSRKATPLTGVAPSNISLADF
jgi:hypothetical protein